MTTLYRRPGPPARDDMILGTVPLPATENIDFLQFVDNAGNEAHYLRDNINLAACRKYSCLPLTQWHIGEISRPPKNSLGSWQFKQRLQNVCWRRMAINNLRLPHVCPTTINWDKMSDDTWLFGPRIIVNGFKPNIAKVGAVGTTLASSAPLHEPIHEVSDADSAILALSVFGSDDDYELDLSSASSYTHQPESLYERISTTSCISYSGYGNTCFVKPILKRGTPTSFYDLERRLSASQSPSYRRKRVSFSYVVSSREFVHNQPCDFQFLNNERV